MARLHVSARVMSGATVAMLFGISSLTVAQSPPVAPASAAASLAVASPGAPVAQGLISWKRVTKGKDFTSNPGAYSVAQLPDGRLVVLGTIGNSVGETTGAGWVSANGSKWARLKIKAPKGSAITAIGELDGTLVATGTAGAGIAGAGGLVWTSADGTAWSGTAPVAGPIYTLLSTPDGLIGAGLLGDAAAAWTTTDAVNWTPVTLAPQARALHILRGDDGTLVIAGAMGGLQGDSSPAVWTSMDSGVTWTQTVFQGLTPGYWSIPAAAVTPFGYVVTLSEQASAGTIGHVWSSPDGTTWSEVLLDRAGSLLAAGAIGTDALIIGHGQVLRSATGATWEPTDEESFQDWLVRDVMTLADGRLFAAGDAFVGNVDSALAVWTGVAAPAP